MPRSTKVLAVTGSTIATPMPQATIAQASANKCISARTSSLLQVPMVRRMLRPDRKVGVLTAHRQSLTPAHLQAVGVDPESVCILGMEGQPEFEAVILEGLRHAMDLERLEAEVVAQAVALVNDRPEVGALVLECTDMPPFAHRIQQRTGLPVFDLSTLTNMVGEAVNRQPCRGIMPR